MAITRYKEKGLRITLNQHLILDGIESAFRFASEREIQRELSQDKALQLELGAALHRIGERRKSKGQPPLEKMDVKPTASYAKELEGYVPEITKILVPPQLMPHVVEDGFKRRVSPKKVEAILSRLCLNGVKLVDVPATLAYEPYTADMPDAGGASLHEAIELMPSGKYVGHTPPRSKTRTFFEKLTTAIEKGLHL